MARPASNTLHTLLFENDTLQPLVARLRRVNALQQIYFEALADALPELEGFAQASRVEVQPDWGGTTTAAAPARFPARNPIPDEQLADLAGSLSDSPLKSALEQIKNRRRRKKTTA